MAEIKDRIKQLRKEYGYTQEGLAQVLGLNAKSSIANYESGANYPSDDIKLKMCSLFNCTMDYLMGTNDFKNNEEDLKYGLIKDLKSLELDQPDLEKAITAFIENYIILPNNPSIHIYDMEDSLIYYAYELITKYFFKLVNHELEALTNNSKLLEDRQSYFIKAEEYAWVKMKKILEDIDEKEIISKLTAEQKVDKLISNLGINSKVFLTPVYRQNKCRTT